MRVGVVVNTSARRPRAAGRATMTALAGAGHHVTNLTANTYAQAARRALNAVDDNRIDALVVVGGDGMVHLGVNVVAERDIMLGIVAVGTGNDFARALDLPIGDTRAGVRTLVDALSRRPRHIDAGVVTRAGRSTWFAGALSAGLDAVVNARANRVVWLGGSATYTWAALTEITRFRPYGYRVSLWGPDTDHIADTVAGVAVTHETDGRVVWHAPGTLVAVANSGWIGGGVHVAPDASLTDGLFDVVVAGALSRTQVARVFPGMYSGRHLTHPRVGVLRAARVLIEPTNDGARPPVAFADGEQIGLAPLEVRVAPGALRVIGA